MPQIRFTTSALGNYIEPKIESFLKGNITYMKSLKESSLEDGAETIANAISYGIAIALSSSMMQSSFSLGICPPPIPPSAVTPGGPVGSLIYAALKPQVLEI